MVPLLALLLLSGVGDGPPWNRYRPATFREILRALEPLLEQTRRDASPGRDWHLLDMGAAGYRVTAVFTGERRPVPPAHAHLMDLWARSSGRRRIARLATEEIRVRQGGDEYWVALQQAIAAHFHEDTRPGEEVELFLACLGADRGSWVFLVNAFDTPAAPPAEAPSPGPGTVPADGGAPLQPPDAGG